MIHNTCRGFRLHLVVKGEGYAIGIQGGLDCLNESRFGQPGIRYDEDFVSAELLDLGSHSLYRIDTEQNPVGREEGVGFYFPHIHIYLLFN